MPGTESGQAPGRKPESESDMQGQANLQHENQQNSSLASVSTANNMDEQPQQQPQQPAATSTAPQIRSRITVVCAECKRLKLKCDRKTPCGSCSKRDTVSRCIYSPAAAEKVDLHSLNNRLVQVETILSMLTAGKTPPPFQSSYPPSQLVASSSLSLSSKPHPTTSLKTNIFNNAHSPSPLSSSSSLISLRLDDLTDIWLAHCQLDGSSTPSTRPHPHQSPLKTDMPSSSTSSHNGADSGAYVKTEPDTLQLAAPYHESSDMLEDETSNGFSSAQHRLPPIHIYYSSPVSQPHNESAQQPSPYTYPTLNRYPTDNTFPPSRQDYEFPPSSPQKQHQQHFYPPQNPHQQESTLSSRPSSSPTLMSLLPPPPTRSKLLSTARLAHPHLALLIHWTKITNLSNPETSISSSSKGEKERQKALAVFFNGATVTPTPTPTAPIGGISIGGVNLVAPSPGGSGSSRGNGSSNSNSSSLPLFACLCYLLALGALESTPNNDPLVDHAFLYALGGQAISIWEEYRTSAASEDVKIDGITSQYHLGGKKKDVAGKKERLMEMEREKEDMDHLLAVLLQVKYMLRARVVVAGPSSTETRGLVKAAFTKIGKLVNMGRALGLSRDPSEDSTSPTQTHGLKRTPKAEERRRMIWWDIMFYDVFTSDVLNQSPLITSYSYSTRLPLIAQTPSTASSSVPQQQSTIRPISSSSSYPPNRKYLSPADDSAVDGDNDDDDDECHNPSSSSYEIVMAPPLAEEAGNEKHNRVSGAATTSRGRNGVQRGSTSASSLSPPTPSKGKTKGKMHGVSPPAQVLQVDGIETGFFGVRCRLTRLAQMVKHRLAHPGCDVCVPCNTCNTGYTLNDAARLEAEIRAWTLDDLPGSLGSNHDADLGSTTSPRSRTSTTAETIIAAELSILANRMIISVYVPLMRTSLSTLLSSNEDSSSGSGNNNGNGNGESSDGPSPSSSTSSSSPYTSLAYSAAHAWSPASRATVEAARSIVRAVKVLHGLLATAAAQSGSSSFGPINTTSPSSSPSSSSCSTSSPFSTSNNVSSSSHDSFSALRTNGMSGTTKTPSTLLLLTSEHHPLEKALTDALIICAHAALNFSSSGSGSKSDSGRSMLAMMMMGGGGSSGSCEGVMEDVMLAFEVLNAMGFGVAGEGVGDHEQVGRRGERKELERIVEALRRRVGGAAAVNAGGKTTTKKGKSAGASAVGGGTVGDESNVLKRKHAVLESSLHHQYQQSPQQYQQRPYQHQDAIISSGALVGAAVPSSTSMMMSVDVDSLSGTGANTNTNINNANSHNPNHNYNGNHNDNDDNDDAATTASSVSALSHTPPLPIPTPPLQQSYHHHHHQQQQQNQHRPTPVIPTAPPSLSLLSLASSPLGAPTPTSSTPASMTGSASATPRSQSQLSHRSGSTGSGASVGAGGERKKHGHGMRKNSNGYGGNTAGSVTYPSVGIRDRGKEGAPWMAKRAGMKKEDGGVGGALERQQLERQLQQHQVQQQQQQQQQSLVAQSPSTLTPSSLMMGLGMSMGQQRPQPQQQQQQEGQATATTTAMDGITSNDNGGMGFHSHAPPPLSSSVHNAHPPMMEDTMGYRSRSSSISHTHAQQTQLASHHHQVSVQAQQQQQQQQQQQNPAAGRMQIPQMSMTMQGYGGSYGGVDVGDQQQDSDEDVQMQQAHHQRRRYSVHEQGQHHLAVQSQPQSQQQHQQQMYTVSPGLVYNPVSLEHQQQPPTPVPRGSYDQHAVIGEGGGGENIYGSYGGINGETYYHGNDAQDMWGTASAPQFSREEGWYYRA